MTTKELMDYYFEKGLAMERITDFETFMDALREPKNIVLVANCLRRVFELYEPGDGEETQSQTINARAFLAAFMIVKFAPRMFDAVGPVEEQLKDVAQRLVSAWELIWQALRTGDVSNDTVRDFALLNIEYYDKFNAWKIPDEIKLRNRICSALDALYAAEEHIPPGEDPNSQLVVEFRTQIARLRAKLAQLNNGATLEAYDLSRQNRGAVTQQSVVSDRFVPRHMTNDELAHELLLNPDFRLTEFVARGPDDCNVFREAFWVAMEADMRDNSFVRARRVVVECVGGVDDLASPNIAEQVKANFSLEDFNERMGQCGATLEHRWEAVAGALRSLMLNVKLVQSPGREVETANLWAEHDVALGSAEDKPRAICKAAEFVLGRVNTLRVDAANARIRLIAPVIKDFGVEHERKKFAEKVRIGQVALERTRRWLRAFPESRMDCVETLAEIHTGSAQHLRTVYRASFVDLLTGSTPISFATCPETLLLDLGRLQRGQEEFRHLVLSTVIVSELEPHYSKALGESRQEDVAKITEAAQKFLAEAKPTADYAALLEGLGEALLATGLPSDLDCVRGLGDPKAFLYFMTSYDFSVHWKDVFVRGAPVSNLFEAKPHASPFRARIETLFESMGKAWDLNDKVHSDIYQMVLRQEAAHYIRVGVDRYIQKVADARKVLAETKDCPGMLRDHEEAVDVLMANLNRWKAALPAETAAPA